RKIITIPLSTYDAAPLLHTYDDSPPQRWANGTSNGHQAGVIIDQFRQCAKTITIEGGTSTGDTTSIGGGVNDLRLVITAQQNDIIERNYDQLTNRGGGGGGGGAVIGVTSSSSTNSSGGGQTPPTPQSATAATPAAAVQEQLEALNNNSSSSSNNR
ncbi:uncharacterized protein LOC116804937, partial [Drosophila grimshawi]|uniref:uncharacterized protein LOC116804937 n=1 Tax=Drosophila grimshawi TaxID=7222 RepID=UPI001C935289